MKNLCIAMIAIAFLGGCTMNNDKKSEQVAVTASNTEVSQATASESVQPEAEKKNTVADIAIGMPDEKVRALLGKPSKVDVLNTELGARMEDWWYGSNQMIRIEGGQVIRIIPNVKAEQEMLMKIKEAQEKGDEAEARRLRDSLKL
jgi:hypothetical protein